MKVNLSTFATKFSYGDIPGLYEQQLVAEVPLGLIRTLPAVLYQCYRPLDLL